MSDTEKCGATYGGEHQGHESRAGLACQLPAGHEGGHRATVLKRQPVQCHRCSRTYGNLGGGQDSALAAYLTGWTRTQDGGWDCGCPTALGWAREDELADDERHAHRLAQQAEDQDAVAQVQREVADELLPAARNEALRLLGIAPARIQWPDSKQ